MCKLRALLVLPRSFTENWVNACNEVDMGGEEDFLADIAGENKLIEVHDQAIQDELNDYARQIFVSNDEANKVFNGFQVN